MISIFAVSNRYSCSSSNHLFIAFCDTLALSLLGSCACYNARSGNQSRNNLYHFSLGKSLKNGVSIFKWQTIIWMQSNKSGLVCPYPIHAILEAIYIFSVQCPAIDSTGAWACSNLVSHNGS